MSYAATPFGRDERPPAPIAPRWSRPSGRKNAHRGLATCRRPASGKPCSQALVASGKNRRSPTTARRAHLLPQSNQQRQQQCTAAQQEAAQLASAFEGVSRVSDLYALGSGLGTLLAGAGEGITFGADTPITITFGSAATFFGGAALVTSAAASALNSFASGNLNSLGSFDLSHLGGIGASAIASRIPGVGSFAENILNLAEKASAIAAAAQEACQ